VKKLLLTVLIAAMMILPLGTVAMADDKPITEVSAEPELIYVPGEAPAQNSVQFMTPALHAVLLAMENQNVLSFTTEDPLMSWEMLYNLLSMYGQMDERASYDGELLILPAEAVMDFSAALFDIPLSPDTLPEDLYDRITYHADCDEYRLYCGSDDLSEVVITNIRDLGSALAVSGKLMFVAEEMELASFSATLSVSDNLFGYTLTGLDVI
jgi:hypothetical protein